jgi:GT2 family glycosyltransferase
MFVPESIVYHKFRLSIAPWKEFYLERNRYLMLLKNCSFKMLILMSPALFVSEVVTWGHAVLNGYSYMYNKLKAYFWIFRTSIVDLKKSQHNRYHIFK